MKLIAILMVVVVVAACVTGEKVVRIDPGMSVQQVTSIMGKPDGFSQSGEYTIYKYVNRLISGWSWDRADYSFIFKNETLIEYGPGEVRERDVGGVHSVFIYQM